MKFTIRCPVNGETIDVTRVKADRLYRAGVIGEQAREPRTYDLLPGKTWAHAERAIGGRNDQ